MKVLTGLNPYGLWYHLGLHAAGTPRANPRPAGLRGYIALATELGARSIELWDGWLLSMPDEALDALRLELGGRGMVPIVSSGLAQAQMERLLEIVAARPHTATLRFTVLGYSAEKILTRWLYAGASLFTDTRARTAWNKHVGRAQALIEDFRNTPDGCVGLVRQCAHARCSRFFLQRGGRPAAFCPPPRRCRQAHHERRRARTNR